ncbi:sulfate ABC transporter substrate-binding protein [Ameyamaea chiangmaiensis]|nr:sulfate ABC transporter substrate-binding protein [Ameyamaea chiangmaiensis]
MSTNGALTRRAALAVAAGLTGAALVDILRPAPASRALLNVSYDPTRELYTEINRRFAARWAQAHDGALVMARTSNGGSGAQARSVLEGQPADVVTLGLGYDIDMLARAGLVARDWQTRLPHNATPFTSTIVFLVRKGNPKAIRDWPDLIRPDVSVITPNPKTSGGARWNYLAAWGWALRQPGASEASALAYMRALFAHVPVLDTGARGATNSFVQRQLGDVLLAWENEALLAATDVGPDAFDLVRPSISVLAEPPVALIEGQARARGTLDIAQAYLAFLFSPEGQDVGARHFFRPSDPAAMARTANRFAPMDLFDIASLGGWSVAQKTHFASGGTFDRIYSPR